MAQENGPRVRMLRASNGKLCPVPPGRWDDDPNNPINAGKKPVGAETRPLRKTPISITNDPVRKQRA